MIVKCEGCGSAVDRFFAFVSGDKKYCGGCITIVDKVNDDIEVRSTHGRIFTDELKALVKFHVEHNDMEHDNFQMAAYLGELVSVIDSKKFLKLKREINEIVKNEINKRITQGIEDKLDEYSHTRPYEAEE